MRRSCVELYRRMSADGFRVVAVAFRWVPDRSAYARTDEAELVLADASALLQQLEEDGGW